MSSAADNLAIRFWGVRGSIPTPNPDKSRYGGNTPCLSVQQGLEPPVILDAGTGLLSFAAQHEQIEEWACNATIFFSHFHWDHIQGFPFLQCLYSERSRFRLYSTFDPKYLEQTLRGQMQEPYFPVPYSAIRAKVQYAKVPEEGLQIGSLRIRPIRLNHPGGCSGYRIDSPSGSVVYASDHEHGVTSIDSEIVEIARGARVLIYDAHFTPAEYRKYKGWGHSTWLEGAKIAKRAGVERLILFHHNPSRTDDALAALLSEARSEFPCTEAAQESQPVVISLERTLPDNQACRC